MRNGIYVSTFRNGLLTIKLGTVRYNGSLEDFGKLWDHTGRAASQPEDGPIIIPYDLMVWR